MLSAPVAHTDCEQRQRGGEQVVAERKGEKLPTMSRGLNRHRMAKAEPAVAWGWAVTQNPTDPQ